jgi:hypothetical protein
MASNKRKITSTFLKAKGFTYNKEKRLWVKRTDDSGAYVWYTYEYDWKNRVLSGHSNDICGYERTSWVINNEIEAYREILTNI